jgi:predicted nucleotidyltransferase
MTTRLIDSATKSATSAFRKKLDHHFQVRQTLLFGSRARRDYHNESDADVAVLLTGLPGKFIETKFAMDDLAYEVLLDSGIRIQPLPIWQTEWDHPEQYSNPELLRNIQREGILL